MTEYEKLISAHDGDMALYYIWLKENNSSNKEQAAKDLCMTMARINAAEEMLIRYEVFGSDLPVSHVTKVQPASKDPHYLSEDIVRSARENPLYASLITECEKTLGAGLTKEDTEKLLNIYHNLDLTPEAIYILLHYFTSEFEEEKITMNRISTLAYIWSGLGISTAEQAEAWVENRKKYTKRERKIKNMLGIQTRLVGGTVDTIDGWIDQGYTDEQILKAYEVCLEKTGKLVWQYMTKVLKSLSEESGKEAECKKESALPDSIVRRKRT